MNNRDPFNLRRSAPAYNLLQSSAASLGQRAASAGQQVTQLGKDIIEDVVAIVPKSEGTMASSYAINAPTHRHHDQWQSSGQSRFAQQPQANGGSVSEKISGMFDGGRRDSLPMYKDKPFAYPGGRKRLPWYRQKRTIFVALTALAGVSWWFGILSPLSYVFGGNSDVKSKPTSSWSLFGSKSNIDWDGRAERVKDAFKLSFDNYEENGWGTDEYHPIAKDGRNMVPNGMGWIIIDALDTMMLMNLTSELAHSRQWIHHNLTYDQDHDVSTFETTIRMLGGLLAAHYLTTSFPGVYAPVEDGLSDDMYIEKASDLADRLLGAFETQSGVPLASVNLHTMKGIPSHADAGASSTAEATSVQLELKYLAKLTGEDQYWDKAEHVMKVVDDNHMPDGLLPIFIHADRGAFRGNNIRLGSRGDSYYEYLIKQYLQTSEQEPVYKTMWDESMVGIKKHLITYSYPSNFTVLAEKPSGLDNPLTPKMDHLVCFMPGTIALAATGGMPVEQARKLSSWGVEQEEDMLLAEELMKTCWGMYATTPTGLAGEITYFNIHDPPLMFNDFDRDAKPQSPKNFDPLPNLPGVDSTPIGQDDYVVKSSDAHNLQRPETIESLFYMWRITGDIKYREWGWTMFESFVKHTAVVDGAGYSSIGNVMTVPPPTRDNMESFWLAETLKYFYLLFSSNDILPLTDVVFNTEAHAFPRFQMGKLFTTGWERKSKAADAAAAPSMPGTKPSDIEKKSTEGHVEMQTIAQTMTVLQTSTVAAEANVASTSVAVEATAVEPVVTDSLAG